MNTIVFNREIALRIFNDGPLKNELAELLNALIDDELMKADGEADFDLIDEYCDLLNDMQSEYGVLRVLGKLQSSDEFLNRVSDIQRRKYIKRTLQTAIAACAVLALIFTANTVTEKTTGVDVLANVARAVRSIFIGERQDPTPDSPSTTDGSVTKKTSEPVSEPFGDKTEIKTAPSVDAASDAVTATEAAVKNSHTKKPPETTGSPSQSSVKPKDPSLHQVLSPEEPPTSEPAETTAKKPFIREDEYETAAPQIIKLSPSYGSDFKRDYKVGEAADFSGLTITALYDNGSRKQIPVSSCDIHGFSTESPVNRIVTVTYEGCSFSFLIRVEEA